MAVTEIHIQTKMSREELREIIQSIPSAIAGTGRDTHGLHKGFIGRVAKVFFDKVHENFILKSKGAGGEDDEHWEDNTPEHLAYSKWPKYGRRGRGKMPMNLPGGPGKHGQHGRPPRGTGELNNAQLRQWFDKYYKQYWVYRRAGVGHKESQHKAAQDAWKYMKGLGADTKLKRFGSRYHRILIGKGTLLDSLEAGVLSDAGGYAGTYVPKRRSQVFRDNGTSFETGTRVDYAKYHHHDGRGVMPRRRLWPKEFPDTWNREIHETVKQQMVAFAKSLTG